MKTWVILTVCGCVLWLLIGIVVAIKYITAEFKVKKDLTRPQKYTFKTYIREEGTEPVTSYVNFAVLCFLLCIGWPFVLRRNNRPLTY